MDLRTDAIPALIRKIAAPAAPGDQFPLPVVIVDAACAGLSLVISLSSAASCRIVSCRVWVVPC